MATVKTLITTAVKYLSKPISMPTPASTQITAADVTPTTIPCRVRITPAPIKPMPVMICPTILPGSTFPPDIN